MAHEIFQVSDCNPPFDVTSVFLEISKAFRKVWDKGLLYEVKSMGILMFVCAIFYQIFIFSPNDSPSKNIKSFFYLIEKALFVFGIFKFL